MQTHHGAPSYHLAHDLVSLFITQEGGHLAPVHFNLGGRIVSPYALAPWLPDEIDPTLPVLLKNLRGDFLCLPFGPRENAQPHGETANSTWQKISENSTSLTLRINPTDLAAEVTKTLTLSPAQTAIYYEHTIKGLDGNFSYGNHPILDLSALPEGSGQLSVNPYRWGSVYPTWFSDPADGASQALKIGARFTDLTQVPLLAGGETDLTRYPSRPGTDDLVMMVSEPATAAQPFAWSAVVMDGYVWFSLKNPDDFPATMLWLSNGGRSAAPWNSRHLGRIGIEDVCSHYCDSLDISRQDRLAAEHIPTTRHFDPETPVHLRNIQAVAATPPGFGTVKTIRPASPESIHITDQHGTTIITTIDWGFVT